MTKKLAPTQSSAALVAPKSVAARVNARGSSVTKKGVTRTAPVSTVATGKVSKVTAGGYTVFTSPVRPVHRTRSEIAAAIADLE